MPTDVVTGAIAVGLTAPEPAITAGGAPAGVLGGGGTLAGPASDSSPELQATNTTNNRTWNRAFRIVALPRALNARRQNATLTALT